MGLTASIGCGDSSTSGLKKSIEYTLRICANLDAHCISRVRENCDELRRNSTTSSYGRT